MIEILGKNQFIWRITLGGLKIKKYIYDENNGL
jgi:hypothetical protein